MTWTPCLARWWSRSPERFATSVMSDGLSQAACVCAQALLGIFWVDCLVGVGGVQLKVRVEINE